MALPRVNGSKYDVFISFRGEDTRHSFTDHLHAALVRAGILPFRDSDDAERGEELKQEIENAIKASDASIIVLSENYATSTWCLDELSLILDQRRDRNHFVLPIFYHVDPSDVGKQKGSFKIQADSSRRRWTDDNVDRWKAALTEVVGVIGMTLVGPETKFIKEVVDTINNRLDRKQIYLPRNLTGMDSRYTEIASWLKKYENQFLVIYGMAGSGKSTLARYIVHLNCQHFECYSIVESIDSRCQEPYNMVRLQQQLCDDISKGKDTRIPSLSQGTSWIEVLLEKKKALIVLDDIVKVGQLDDLLGRATINKESKIIITTHNDIISDWFVSTSKSFQKYTMRLLNDDEALELLSLHAFQSKLPKDGYNVLAQQVVQHCDGSPLALEVLGSSLSHINTITSWESELRSYKKNFNDKINSVLIKSYDSIPSILEKELFLHIACFFVGKDLNYVVKILNPDYPAESKIETLIKRGFLYVTSDKKLRMHRLLQEMGRYLADRESHRVAKRTRVWRNTDSYHMLRTKKKSDAIQGLALDIQMLMKEDNMEPSQLKELSTDSLQRMDQLKYLQLNYVQLTGSYKNLSEHIRWLCWVGFEKSTVHAEILTWSIVALDMSYSCLVKFEPPTVMPSLKILNLKESSNLLEIRSMNKIPNLETLIVWNCRSLFRICRDVGDLERLSVLIMTGCENLFMKEHINTSVEPETSASGGERAHELSFHLPHSLQRVLLDECNLECTDYFTLSFSDQLDLEYINLGNGLFELLPGYNHLKDLRILDLRNCSKLKRLVCLPSTLAELYIYDCSSIEKISFESGQFTLQEFGYEGCITLSEIEGLAKLLLVAKLDETDLGHLIWLKEYQNHEVCLIGDYQLIKGRSCHLQMLYEFNVMSTSLPDIMHPNLMPEYRSQFTSLSFEVPACPTSSLLKGLNVTFRYTISGDSWLWFAKIYTTNGVDIMYSPLVFGNPGVGQVGIWLSYWPIGNLLDTGDEVKVSIAVMSGLELLECGASLVYTDDNVAPEILKNKTGWVETFGRDLSAFHLIKGSYYLCQRDIYKMMEIGRLTSGWLSNLVGDSIDDTEVRGWRMTGRPQQSYQSYTELKTGRYIIHGHEMEETGKFVEKIMPLEPATLLDRMRSATKFVSTDTGTKVGGTATVSIGTIQETYDVLLKEAKIRFGLYTSSSGIKVLAFMTRPLLRGDYELELEDKAIDFISTGAEDSLFSVNKNAIELFNGFTDRLKEIENEHIFTPLIITGWGLGGMIAILSALRLQRAVDVEESKGVKGTKRPMCITFGAPLVGGEAFQQAIAKRPQWKSGFLNVVVKKDNGVRCFPTKDGYKPFGTFLFCTESGDCTALEDEKAIMAVLDTMASPDDADSLSLQDYNQVLSSIRRRVLIRGGASDLGEGNTSLLMAGIALQLKKVGVSNNSLINEMEKQAKKSKKNAYEPTKKLNEIKISMSYMEWYIKNERDRAGYYDCYKNERRSRDDYDRHQVILKHKLILNQYWKKFVEEKDQMPQKDGAKLRKHWLYSGNNYRLMIEPLDIGEHYKQLKEKENNNDAETSYIANRPNHYMLLEKWLMEDKKNANPSDEKKEAFNLSKDSCFWAHVEEAIISLRRLKDGSSNSNRNVLEQKLENFMAYVMRAVSDFMVSSDIFLEGSSLRKWWDDYNTYEEGSCDSEFARYMKSGRYNLYK